MRTTMKRLLVLSWMLSSTSLLAGNIVTHRVILTTDAGEITFLAAGADGRYLTAASLDSHVFVWETSSWKRVASILPEPPPKAAEEGHQDEYSAIHGLAFSPDNRTVAFASAGVLYTYDIRSKTKRVRGKTDSEALAFTPDGTRLLASTTDGSVEIWLRRTWRKRIVAIPLRDADAVSGAISVSGDGRYAAVSGDGGVGILDLTTMMFKMLPLPTGATGWVHGGMQIGISSDNRFVASPATSFKYKSLVVWDVAKNAVVFTTKTEDEVWAVAFSSDTSRLFAGQPGGKIVGWSTGTWNEVCTLDTGGQYQFAASARWLAAGGGDQDITIIPMQECTTN